MSCATGDGRHLIALGDWLLVPKFLMKYDTFFCCTSCATGDGRHLIALGDWLLVQKFLTKYDTLCAACLVLQMMVDILVHLAIGFLCKNVFDEI